MYKDQLRSFLAAAGAAATRRHAAALVRSGRVTLNGVMCKVEETIVRPRDEVHLDGTLVHAPTTLGEARLWRHFKTVGLVVTHDDPLQRATLFETPRPDYNDAGT
jgi:16S rRNA U516 pseudouridylate synthase RsuA-like enzyme